MIAVLAIDTGIFDEATFRHLMEEFFAGRITHGEVARQMEKTPQEIATILGSLFVIGAKRDNLAAQLEVKPDLNSQTYKQSLGDAKLPRTSEDLLLFFDQLPEPEKVLAMLGLLEKLPDYELDLGAEGPVSPITEEYVYTAIISLMLHRLSCSTAANTQTS